MAREAFEIEKRTLNFNREDGWKLSDIKADSPTQKRSTVNIERNEGRGQSMEKKEDKHRTANNKGTARK